LAIDVGADAINRSGNSVSSTIVDGSNPANADGTIDTVQIFANTNMSTCRAATFYVVSGNNLSTRDYETLGVVTAGSTQTFSGLDIDVLAGDYIGEYHPDGSIDHALSGGVGYWRAYGSDKIPCTNEEFTWNSGRVVSLYGTGTEGGGATEKTGSDTGAGADAKASGSPLAAINGSETGSGADSLPSRDIALPESGAGVDALVSLQTPAAKTSFDAGSGVEGTPLPGATLAAVDNGAGVDALVAVQMPAAKTSSDAGSGVEAIPVSGAVLAGSESGSGVEAFITRLLAAAETGCGTEASEIGGGGMLKHLFAGELGEGADGLTAKIEIPTKGGGMRLWT